MKYKVDITCRFDNESDAKTLMDFAKNLVAKATSINEDKINAEISYILTEKCYHDELPTKPCEITEKQEVHKGHVVIVKEAKAMER